LESILVDMKAFALIALFMTSFLVVGQGSPELDGGLWVTGPERAAWNARMVGLQDRADELDLLGFTQFVEIKKLEEQLSRGANCNHVRPI
jgi:hypothetical protein